MILSAALYGAVPGGAILFQFRPLLLILSFLVAIMWLSLNLPKFFEYFCKLTAIILAASALVSVIAFFQADIHPRAIADFRLVPILGTPTYQGSTTVSTTYAVFFVATFTLLLARRSRLSFNIVLGVAAAVLLVAVALTQARGAIIAVVAGVMVTGISLHRRGVLIAVAFLAVVGLISLYPPFWEALLSRGSSYRDGIWLTYLAWGLKRPLFGYGALTNVHQMVQGFEFFHAHNLFLSSWIRGGVLGLASMTTMFGAGVYWSIRYLRRSGDPTILAMMVSLAAAGIFDYELLITYPDWMWVTFWLPIGLAAGAEVSLRSTKTSLERSAAKEAPG